MTENEKPWRETLIIARNGLILFALLVTFLKVWPSDGEDEGDRGCDHLIQPGQTVYLIASLYDAFDGMTGPEILEAILSANPDLRPSNGDEIDAGNTLHLPLSQAECVITFPDIPTAVALPTSTDIPTLEPTIVITPTSTIPESVPTESVVTIQMRYIVEDFADGAALLIAAEQSGVSVNTLLAFLDQIKPDKRPQFFESVDGTEPEIVHVGRKIDALSVSNMSLVDAILKTINDDYSALKIKSSDASMRPSIEKILPAIINANY